MASIIYNKAMEAFFMYRGALDDDGNPIGEYYREYMKKHPVILGLRDVRDDKKLKMIHSTKDDLLKIFNISNNTEPSESFIVSKDFDCWVCFDENFRVVLYFGEDMPVRKEKSYKTICKAVKIWKYYNIDYSSKVHIVKCWNVNDSDKMLICGLGYEGARRLFPEIYDRVEYSSQISCDTLWRLEPFRIKRNWDIPEDIKKAQREREEAIQREEDVKRLKIEILKRTPGYCDRCGDKAYYKIETPYSVTELCEYCFNEKFYLYEDI